jgi:Carbohydrate binding domain
MAEQSWTDDPITAGATRIRKKPIHFTELQDAINLWESAYSISNTNFTDSPATGVGITATAITEMQDALDDLDTLASGGGFSWTEPSNLITNGNFDSATTGWTPVSCTIASVVWGQDGNCLQMTRTGGDYQDAWQSFTTVIGEEYLLSCYVKSGTSGNETFDIYAYEIATPFANAHIRGTTSGTWTKYTMRFTATAVATRFYMRKIGITAGTMLLDTVVAYKANVPIKPAHINELRTNMNIMQNDYCYVCDSCDTDTGCNECNMVCNVDACDQCDTGCYGYSGCSICHNSVYNACGAKDYGCTCYTSCYTGYSACTCNSSCNNDHCDQCDASCYEDTCAHCDNSTYRYPWT